jgi:hypothetical protein
MASMEIAVRDLLHSVMQSDAAGEAILLDEGMQTLLATWFSKCVYAYAANSSLENRPWSEAEYRDLRTRRQPSARATIWAGKNIGLLADIALSVTPLFLTPLDPQHEGPGEEQPGAVCAWLSANSVVFYGQWWPSDMVDAGVPERLAGAEVNAMLRIWPPSEATVWPDGLVTDAEAFTLVNRFASVRDALGIPLEGHNTEELDKIKSDLIDSAASQGQVPKYAIQGRRIFSRPEDHD